MKTTLLKVMIFSAAVYLVACGGNNGDGNVESSTKAISTELINNPNSATKEEIDPELLPVMTFDDIVYQFGQISQGEKVQHAFKFTNTGKSALIISSAEGSCGCTVPEWPREPVAPGESAVIDVVFDSNGKKGKQTKTVTVTANTDPAKTVLTITGEVLAAEPASS